jgi:hypothetical protein
MTSLLTKATRNFVLVCFLMPGPLPSLLAQKASPFAIPGRLPPPQKKLTPQYPQPKKITPAAKTLPSPYDLRGCYNFEGKWYFALYHKSTRESAWLTWDENATSITYAGDVFIFDDESFQVTHESSNPQVSYESIVLTEASKASGAAFNPSAPKAAKPAKTPSPPVKGGNSRVIPRPTKK